LRGDLISSKDGTYDCAKEARVGLDWRFRKRKRAVAGFEEISRNRGFKMANVEYRNVDGQRKVVAEGGPGPNFDPVLAWLMFEHVAVLRES